MMLFSKRVKLTVAIATLCTACGLMAFSMFSKADNSTQVKKSSKATQGVQKVKLDKPTGIKSDADISIQLLEKQLGDTTVVKIGSTSQMLNYLSKKNSVLLNNPPIRISAVDNSKLKYFPPISNQGSIGSCTSWATVYYQLSYTVNKTLKRDGKQPENMFSPTWVYNMTNGGINQGTFYSDCLQVLKEVGAVPMTMVPAVSTESGDSVRNVHAQKENWLEARKYKVKEFYNVDIKNREYDTVVTCPTDVDLDAMKKALALGEVLSATTYSYKWVRQPIEENQYVKTNSKYKGQTVITRCDGTEYGAHRITIVGYDDDIWVDINQNGRIEKAEKGAFKIANSWGTDYDNEGFIWMSYDALNRVSAVSDSEQVSLKTPYRDAGLFDIIGFTVDVDESDSDCMLALDLETDNAYSVLVDVIAKDKETGEEHYYNPVPFSNASIIFGMGAYPFNGLASDNKGEFYIDLGNCVKGITKDDLGKYDWSIHVSDMVFDASTVKVNNARMYIVSDNKYINSDLQQSVTLDTTNTKVATKIIRFNIDTPVTPDTNVTE